MTTSPNVLLIMCDQLSSWALSCYGGTDVSTPHIDRLAAEGLAAINIFVIRRFAPLHALAL